MVPLRRSLLVLAIFMVGCRVDQKREVEQYNKVLRANLLNNEDVFAPGKPLSLRQALDLANRQNERLAVEGENYLQAMIDRTRAAAAFLPTVSLAPTFALREKTGGGGNDNNGNSNTAKTHIFDVPVKATALISGYSDLARLGREAHTIEQRRGLLLDLQEQVLLDTARVYYEVLRAERSVDVLENSLAVQDARVRDITGRQRAGLARPLDVAQTEAQASATRVTLINALNDVRNGRSTLAFLTAAPVQDSPLLERYDTPPLATLEQMQQEALSRRHDLTAAREAIRAARQNVEVAFGQYYPSVSLSTNLFLYRESVPDQRTWDALLTANLPIFSAGIIEADVRTAWSQYRQTAMNESLLRRQVAQDVQLGYQNLVAAQKRIEELQVQLAAAEQAFKQADQSYNVGLATNLERVAAQDQLLGAQLQLTSARFERTLSYLSLARATGSLRERLETTTSTKPSSIPTTVPVERRPL